MAAFIFQRADKTVLFAKIADAKSKMMRQGWQVKFHVDRVRFFHRADGAKRFSRPKTSTPEYGENNFRLSASSDAPPKPRKFIVRNMVKKVRVICTVDATHVKAKQIGPFGP
jgi:hypothetical protein